MFSGSCGVRNCVELRLGKMHLCQSCGRPYIRITSPQLHIIKKSGELRKKDGKRVERGKERAQL